MAEMRPRMELQVAEAVRQPHARWFGTHIVVAHTTLLVVPSAAVTLRRWFHDGGRCSEVPAGGVCGALLERRL
jgi:hypothetical protein